MSRNPRLLLALNRFAHANFGLVDKWREAGQAVIYFPLTGPAPGTWAMGSPAYVDAVDPLVFAATSAIMTSIGVGASYMPARRASSVLPIEALKSD